MFANACTDFELELNHPITRNKLSLGALWSPSYFAKSYGGAPISMIYKYIKQTSEPHSIKGQKKEGCAFRAYIPALNGEVLRAHPIKDVESRQYTRNHRKTYPTAFASQSKSKIMSKIQASSALSNLKVLDMSRVRAGPNCVRLLADFGADVIRIEPPKGVDPNEGMFAANREGGDFQNLNRNKRAMTLNLKKPGALDIMMRLVKTADVVVENWRPDIKNRLGVDYESLAKVNPRIILASISGYGQEGPYASRPGFDQIMQGMGGLMSVTGIPGQGPVRAGLAVADMSAGLYAGIGILTALLERERSGKGQWVHASLLHAQIAMMDFQAARYLNEGDVAGQAGNDHPTSSPMGLFEASDGVFNLGASGQGNWVRLCDLAKRPDWMADPDFSNEKTRAVNRAKCNKALNEVFRTNTVEYWVENLNNAGVPAGPVYNVPEMFADEHIKQSHISKMVDDKQGKQKGFITQPAILSRTPADVVTTAPQWGEHTSEVLAEVGYTPEEIAKFYEQGVL